jgi:hypothetical protein
MLCDNQHMLGIKLCVWVRLKAQLMDLADILQSATGKRWILRANKPIEFSPLN